jgi:hypothetical protein
MNRRGESDHRPDPAAQRPGARRMSVLRTIAIMLGVLAFWIIISLFGRREASFHLMIVAAIVLPVLYWMRRPLRWPTVIFLICSPIR